MSAATDNLLKAAEAVLESREDGFMDHKGRLVALVSPKAMERLAAAIFEIEAENRQPSRATFTESKATRKVPKGAFYGDGPEQKEVPPGAPVTTERAE